MQMLANKIANKIRLHKFVTQNIYRLTGKAFSRPEIAKNIQDLGVWVDGKLVKDRLFWVDQFQQVTINWPSEDSCRSLYSEVKILVEEKDFLVLYKPAGLVVQPGASNLNTSLVHWLLANFAEQKELLTTQVGNIKDPIEDPKWTQNPVATAGLVHRLDKDAQGILLVARNQHKLKFFQDQFRNRKVTKKYLALLSGNLQKNTLVEGWQIRSKTNPISQEFYLHSPSRQARYSKSFFRPLKIFSSLGQTFTLAEVRIFTGRMHQIRLHSQFLKTPVVNDYLYGQILPAKNIQAGIQAGIQGNIQADIQTNAQAFEQIKNQTKDIFKGADFCLLSNYLTFYPNPNSSFTIEIQDSNQFYQIL